MVEADLASRGIDTMWFNPWYFRGQDALIRGFLEELAGKLAVRLGTAADEFKRVLDKYGSLLSSLPLSLVGVDPGKVMSAAAAQIAGSTLEDLKRRLERLLTERGVSLVVFMDDIDRLDRAEIHAVLKLVKLVAGFSGVRYVLAFDDEMVAAAVGEAYGHGDVAAGRSFLEKIVQVPLRLPRIDPTTARYLALTEVDRALKGVGMDVDESGAIEFHQHFLPLFDARPRTLRVGKRYGNSLSFALPLLRGEVHAVDLLLIEAVRAFVPTVYAALPQHRALLLGEQSLDWGLDTQLRREREKVEWDGLLSLADEPERKALVNTLAHLFPRLQRITSNMSYSSESYARWTREQRIASPLYFDRFFQYAVPPNDVPDEDIRQFLDVLEHRDVGAALQMFDAMLGGSNAERLIEKLRAHEDALSARQGESLVRVVLAKGPSLPHRRAFLISTAREQGLVLLYKAMLRVPASERLLLADEAVEAPTPLAFALECFGWLAHSERREERGWARVLPEDAERGIKDRLLVRVLERMNEEPFYLMSEREGSSALLWFWARAVSLEARTDFFQSRFAKDPQEAGRLLDALAMRAITSENRRLPPAIEREQYDSICKMVDVNVVLEALLRAFGNVAALSPQDARAAEIEDVAGEASLPDEVRLVRQFLWIHNKVRETRAEASDEPVGESRTDDA